MKETWNLNKTVSSAIFQAAYFEDITSKDAEGIADHLCIEIEANQAILGNELFKAKEEIAKLKDQDKEFHNLIANLHRDHLYVVEELEKKLEAAQRVVEAARKLINTRYDTINMIELREKLDAYYVAEMKDDSLGMKSENIK